MLLLIIYLCCSAIVKSFKCPIKVKIISICVLSVLMLKYISLFMMFLIKNISYTYFFKYGVLISIICIPTLFILMILIFVRSKKLNIICVIGTILILTAVYLYVIIKIPMLVIPASDYGFGYIINFGAFREYVLFIYIIIYIFILTLCGFFMGKCNVNKRGISLLMMALLVNLIEKIFALIGTKIMPEYLLGEIVCLMCLHYVFNAQFKVQNL
jgi:hypothetical protein